MGCILFLFYILLCLFFFIFILFCFTVYSWLCLYSTYHWAHIFPTGNTNTIGAKGDRLNRYAVHSAVAVATHTQPKVNCNGIHTYLSIAVRCTYRQFSCIYTYIYIPTVVMIVIPSTTCVPQLMCVCFLLFLFFLGLFCLLVVVIFVFLVVLVVKIQLDTYISGRE